jgi:2-oxoglutarate dehydrogenase E2 component (dihydrolipoamide succinyltransferase)
MAEIKVPSPGESVLTVTLASWLVADGDFVQRDQEVAEVDSDKATLSISAPEAGVITLLMPAGEQVKVGEVIATIAPGISEDTHTTASKESKATAMGFPATEDTPATITSIPIEKGSSSGLNLTPLARAWMATEQLSDGDILPFQKEGRIRRSDLQKLMVTRMETTLTENSEVSDRGERREKMSPLRIKLSERLVSVRNETAMLTTFNEVDMSEVMRLRSEYGIEFEQKHGVRLGLMAFFARAAALALQSFPVVNAFIDGHELVYHEFVDMGIAVSAPKGLVVPVVRNVHRMTLAGVEQEIRRLADKARQNRLTLDEMTGGTFTITNGGVFGSMLSTPILNPPQSAILGMHNIVERPVAVNGKVEIRPMMYVALSYDHRIIDGRESVGFLIKVKEIIENPAAMVADGNSERLLLGL